MKEMGEELIDLSKDGRIINSQKETKEIKVTNDKNISKINLKIILSIIFSLLIIAFLFFLITYYTQSKKEYKTAIIFDFDKTITELDTFEEQRYLYPSEKNQKDLMVNITYQNWAYLMAKTYEDFYDLNITIEDINKYIDKVKYNKGILELIDYLKEKKEKFILIILSAGHLYQIKRVLQRNNLTNFFDEIVAFPSYEKNGKIIVEPCYEKDCDFCKLGFCKTFEFNLIKKKYELKNIFFDKIYFICDGQNDYCLARNLRKNDKLFVKKDYGLYNYLYNEGFINNIKCNTYKWNNGFDIIKIFQNEEKVIKKG